MPPPDSDAMGKLVFKINVLAQVQQVLTGFSFVQAKHTKVSQMLNDDCSLFVSGSTAQLLSRFGFDAKVSSSPDQALGALQQFYAYVASVGTLSIPHADAIQSAKIRTSVSALITKNLCSSYESIYHAVSTNGEPMHLNPQQVKVLLGCQ
jgi:hypothetical protein